MTKMLALLGFAMLQLNAQVAPVTLLTNLAPGFTQSVLLSYSDTCSQPTEGTPTSCNAVSGTPVTTAIGISSGNQFDGQGNLYFTFENKAKENVLMWMTPEGQVNTLADMPAGRTCTQPTSSSAVLTTTTIGPFTFNVVANTLYVYTQDVVYTWSSAVGSCNRAGAFTGTLSNGVKNSTYALVQVQGF